MTTRPQSESRASSSATHRLTQPSTTLNRHQVIRPQFANFHEQSSSRSLVPQPSQSRPSRLVNLRVHSSELSAQTQLPPEPQLPAPIETPAVTPAPVPESYVPVVQYTPDIEAHATYEAPAEYAATVSSYAMTTPTESTPEPISQPEIDTESLMLSMAADYAAAAFGSNNPNVSSDTAMTPSTNSVALYQAPAATVAESSSTPNSVIPITSPSDMTAPTTDLGSIDAIARAAADAIAAIRQATEPAEIAEQIASLDTFAKDLKNNSTAPEMLELSNTIEKFISIAMKSTKVQEGVKAKKAKEPKVVLTSKANRAAAKVTRSSSKIIAANNKLNRIRTTGQKPVVQGTLKNRSTSNRTAARFATSRVAAKSTAKSSKSSRPSRSIAQDEKLALQQALRSVADEPVSASAKNQRKMALPRRRRAKHLFFGITCATACIAAVIYFIGSNMPDLSVRVAAMQTGIEASYPSYIPRGYTLGDISSENGKITLVFNNKENASFSLIEEKSSWDSTALLRNYVEPTWQSNYTTTHEQGITIYISGSNAAWVNGGVLYKITAKPSDLTKKQLRNIVTSM